MKILALMSQKGGSGKSTLARSLAVAGLCDEKRVALIDADPQQTVIRWAQQRESTAPTVFSTDQKPLPEIIAQARAAGAEFCIIDTPPHLRPLIALVANSVDAVIIPVRPSPDDLVAIGATIEIIRAVSVRAGIVINAAPIRTQSAILARSALSAFALPICPSVISDRIAHQYAASEGLTALEYEPSGKAASEVSLVWQWANKILFS